MSKLKEGAWVTLNPGVKQILDMMLGIVKQPRTVYVRNLIEDDLAERLSGIEGVENLLGMQDSALPAKYKALLKRVASRNSDSPEEEVVVEEEESEYESVEMVIE